MEIKKEHQTKRIHHTVIIDSIPYLRNEEQIYNFKTKEWVRRTMSWSVGDKDGNGPYVIPGGNLDSKGKYTPVILEREFKLLTILQKEFEEYEVVIPQNPLLDDDELKRLIWEEWEGEIKEEDPRQMVLKYMKLMRSQFIK